nr:hypothetical protein [Actinomadura soli]
MRSSVASGGAPVGRAACGQAPGEPRRPGPPRRPSVRRRRCRLRGAEGGVEGEARVGVVQAVAEIAFELAEPVPDGLRMDLEPFADVDRGGPGGDGLGERLDEAAALAVRHLAQRFQVAPGELLDQRRVGQQPHGHEVVPARDEGAVPDDALLGEPEDAARPAQGVRGPLQRQGEADHGTRVGQRGAQHSVARRGERPGDEQARFRGVQVDEDVGVQRRAGVRGVGVISIRSPSVIGCGASKKSWATG